MLNDEEARQLTGLKNLYKISDILLSYGPNIVIIKQGSKGSLLAYADQKINISVVPDVLVYDPTGAGDSFAGGLLGYISKYGIDNPIDAVIHGTAVASFTVSGFGIENLCTMNNNNLKNKIKEIKIL